MAGSAAAFGEGILSALLGGPPTARLASTRSHVPAISGRDSVLRRQFLGKPDETQCDTTSGGCHAQIYAVVIEDVEAGEPRARRSVRA
jgi:hypothetical protein